MPRRKMTPKKNLRHRERHGDEYDLSELALRACRVASDAAFNVKDYLANASRMAFLAVRDCEQELDRIEQETDDQLPAAITQVDELSARELLACSRFSTELERIGDLLWGAVQRTQNLRERLPRADSQQLIAMVEILEKMLHQVRQAFEDRELDPAGEVRRADREIDRLYKTLFRRRLQTDDEKKMQQNAELFLIAQALERTGDHATNLAEELYRLIEGRSLRHMPKKQVRD
jgi:phosphate transport system protein